MTVPRPPGRLRKPVGCVLRVAPVFGTLRELLTPNCNLLFTCSTLGKQEVNSSCLRCDPLARTRSVGSAKERIDERGLRVSSIMMQKNHRPTNPRITIVVPAKNEARNLEIVLPDLPRVHEVVLVDGNSVDGTVEAARSILPGIKVVHQTRRGKGNALACGFAAATGDIIVMFDADCSADPAEIPRFVSALLDGADFAKGSRFQHGGGSADITRFRRFGNRGLNILANAMLRANYTDLCYGYNAFWADICEIFDLTSPDIAALKNSTMIWGDGFEIETVINCRVAAAKLVVTEVPSYERLRVHGVSNLNAVSDGLRVLKTIGTERRRARIASTVRPNEVIQPAIETSSLDIINGGLGENIA